MASSKIKAGTALAGIMGIAATGALLGDLTRWEGKRNVGYLDIAKIPTACMGDTQNVVVGKFYSDAECQERLERQALSHVEDVLLIAPGLRQHPQVLRAAGSMTYNIGAPKFSGSTASTRFRAGDLLGGCLAIGPYFVVLRKDGTEVVTSGFINVNKQPIQGLIDRRTYEMTVCLRGLVK
ncbi:glycoside hydrolase family protein [Sphingobium aquiterrae]|uniref:glycoside hydrolase family protein n=1 Tax=Sphingobium aquiterrae TaxID=2038656 RepID=UPI00301AC659